MQRSSTMAVAALLALATMITTGCGKAAGAPADGAALKDDRTTTQTVDPIFADPTVRALVKDAALAVDALSRGRRAGYAGRVEDGEIRLVTPDETLAGATYSLKVYQSPSDAFPMEYVVKVAVHMQVVISVETEITR